MPAGRPPKYKTPEAMSGNCGECYFCLDELDRKNPIYESTIMSRTNTQLIVCPKCGNKRCPKATDHRNKCTGSNAINQPGSIHQRKSEMLTKHSHA